MKLRIFGRWWKFWGGIGWYSGEEFVLFKLEIQPYNYKGYWFMFSIQVAKFAIEFGIST